MLQGIRRERTLEAILVIAMGLLLFYFIKQKLVFLYASFVSGLIGIFIKPLASLIAIGWYKAGDLLGMVVSKIILAAVYFVLLVPIALLYRLFNRDPLHLKKQHDSNWSVRDHDYSEKDLKNTW